MIEDRSTNRPRAEPDRIGAAIIPWATRPLAAGSLTLPQSHVLLAGIDSGSDFRNWPDADDFGPCSKSSAMWGYTSRAADVVVMAAPDPKRP